MSGPRDYASGIAYMRRLVRAQQEMRATLKLSVLCPDEHRRYDLTVGRPVPGADTYRHAPAAAQAVLQRELHHNARVLTNMHLALAFCRHRRRAGPVPTTAQSPLGVSDWIGVLSKACGWTNVDAVAAQYDRWARWCNDPTTCPETGRPMPADPGPPVAWQREFLRRERNAKRAARAARKSAQGLVPVPAIPQPEPARASPEAQP